MTTNRTVTVVMWDGKPESVWDDRCDASAHLEYLLDRYKRQFTVIPAPLSSIIDVPWEGESPWPYRT
jgi:hypothetical protein